MVWRGGIDQRAQFAPPIRQAWRRSALAWSLDLRVAEKSDRQWSRVSQRKCRTQVGFKKATEADRPIPRQQSEVSAIFGWRE
jgi:hypothetical protein